MTLSITLRFTPSAGLTEYVGYHFIMVQDKRLFTSVGWLPLTRENSVESLLERTPCVFPWAFNSPWFLTSCCNYVGSLALNEADDCYCELCGLTLARQEPVAVQLRMREAANWTSFLELAGLDRFTAVLLGETCRNHFDQYDKLFENGFWKITEQEFEERLLNDLRNLNQDLENLMKEFNRKETV